MVNKAKLLKMYKDGEYVKTIAEKCGCSVKTVYKTAVKHGLHRTGHVKKDKPKPATKPRPKKVDEEPMYREIPTHLEISRQSDEEQKRLVKERVEWQNKFKVWYLK